MDDGTGYGEFLSDRTIRRRAAARADELLTSVRLQTNLDTSDDNTDENVGTMEYELTDLESNADQAAPSEDASSTSEHGDVNYQCDVAMPVMPLSDSDADSYRESDSDETDDTDDDIQFRDNLREWVLNSDTPLVHTNTLLALLRPRIPLLPKDGRTLLKTQRECTIEDIAGGNYHHFGCGEAIKLQLEKSEYLREFDELSLQVNIDGVPLFKSTSHCFWPILALIRQ